MPWLLLARNLTARPLRSALTVGSLLIAVFLVLFLRSVVVALGSGVEAASQSRLIVQSAVSLFVNLPLSYQQKIERVEGVGPMTKLQWFGGYYQDPSNFFAQFAVDEERLLDAYPEIELVEGSYEQFLAVKNGCLIGTDLATKFGWRVGDTVPLIGALYSRQDGSTWDFQVTGIYRSKAANLDSRTLWFHFEYLEDTLESGAASGPEGVGVWILRLERGADATRVMSAIDGLFINGPQRVQTTTESEFQKQFVTMLGSVPTLLTSIGGGVLFAILLAVLNTMLMAARERTRSLGILKALGFGDGTAFALLLGESLLLCLIGGLLGLALYGLAAPGFSAFLTSAGFPPLVLDGESVLIGVVLALLVGLVAGIAPAIRAARLEVIDALAAEV